MIKHIYPRNQGFNGVSLYGVYIDKLLPKVDQPKTELCHFEIGYTGEKELWQAYRQLRKTRHAKYVLTLHDPPVVVLRPFGRYIKSRSLPFKALRKLLDLSLGRSMVKQVVRKAGAIVVLNPLAKDSLIQRYGVSADRLFDSPLPVLTPLAPSAKHERSLRLLFFGNVSERKGVDVLIKACAGLRTQLGDWRLDVAGKPDGDRPYAELVKNLINDASLDERIQLHGFIGDDQLADLIARADIVILPYYDDVGIIHASGPLITSLAAGKAVIATRIPIFTPDIEEGRTGLLFEPGSVDELSRKLLQLASDDRLRDKLGQAARAAIMKTHSEEAIIASLNKAYKSCED